MQNNSYFVSSSTKILSNMKWTIPCPKGGVTTQTNYSALKKFAKTIKKSYKNAVTGKPEIQPHTFVDVYGKDPTCTENGLTDGVACKVCGKVKVEQKVIKARHTDNNDDGYCDICKAETRYHCPYCNQEHAGFFGAFVKIFHNILASFGLKK